MPLDKELRRKILKRLPHGCCLEIAQKAGVSHALVSKWFYGASNNCGIEAAVIEVLEAATKQEKETNERVRAILSE